MSMYGSMEESKPAAAPALGPAEIKFVRKMMATSTGDDDRPAGLLHEPQELSTSTLAKLDEQIPCKDVSAEGDAYDAYIQYDMEQESGVRSNATRWSMFQSFLDIWEDANADLPLVKQFENYQDIKYLRIYGCRYLRDPSLWDSLDSYEAWQADARSNLTVRPPYWLGRNLCVRGSSHKQLSLFCPEACGCHRGDQDCPLTCPERDATTPTCPAHQEKIFVMEGKDAMWEGYSCPRRPQAHSSDVGFSAQDLLSPRRLPPTNCAAASTGACLENGGVDPDCCAPCGEGSCAPGYTYAGQFRFETKMLWSTYPDFDPVCSHGNVEWGCGNTCCVPVDTNETARAATGG
ncbi:unnamed protein product [Pelagomonas calceolata]|uniref:Uncharacterized protein n=1 Tax=Pelagomonas calceolata TaxID=35677 RepID=A0A8J2SWZ1_9STRA|nr:unnamed protein product [Pelagomonas calceolata]